MFLHSSVLAPQKTMLLFCQCHVVLLGNPPPSTFKHATFFAPTCQMLCCSGRRVLAGQGSVFCRGQLAESSVQLSLLHVPDGHQGLGGSHRKSKVCKWCLQFNKVTNSEEVQLIVLIIGLSYGARNVISYARCMNQIS